MRREEFSVDDEEQIIEILGECEYGVLGLIDDNEPYSIPLNFVYFEGRIYFHGALEGRKIDVISKNPIGSFVAVKPYAYIPSYFSDTVAACPATQFFASVFMNGELSIITDCNKKSDVLNALMQKLQSEGGYESIDYAKPMYKKMLEKTAVIEFNPTIKTAKIKVGQNLNEEKKRKMIEKLENRNEDLDNLTIKKMKEIR